MKTFVISLGLSVIGLVTSATAQIAKYDESVPAPTHSGIRYGKHERNELDFWKVESSKPTALVFVIHGGGWRGGDSSKISRFIEVKKLLKQGISVCSIHYRLIGKTQPFETPPVKAPLMDAARALQFVRANAKKWNIDKDRVYAVGGSAGACSSLWLTLHDNMAKPDSKDPVERESTKFNGAAVKGPQTTLDPKQMKEWMSNSRYGGHAFGVPKFADFLASRDKLMPLILKYSPYHQASKDDPEIYLSFSDKPKMGGAPKDPTHSVNFGIGLQKRYKELGLKCLVEYPGANTGFATITDYLLAKLK